MEIVGGSETAHYLLAGRAAADGVEYAWIQKDASANTKGIEEGMSQDALCSAESPYPIRTYWFGAEPSERTSVKLAERAGRLARVYGWLNLPAPTSGAAAAFPYRLEMRELGAKNAGRTAKSATQGHDYGLFLVATGAIPESFRSQWVYVEGISCDGRGVLLYPVSGQNNFQPKLLGHDWPTEVDLTGRAETLTVDKPFGLDTYVLLTTSSQLSDLSVFDFEGAMSRGMPAPDPLARLLGSASSGGTRGIGSKAPADWSVQYLHILSVPQKQSGSSPAKN